MINVNSNRKDIIEKAKADVEARKRLKKNLLKNQNKKPALNKDKKDEKDKS